MSKTLSKIAIILCVLACACSFSACEQRENGKSAYEIWLDNGYQGTQIDFLNWLKGEQGDKGNDGKSAYEIWLDCGNTGTQEDFLNWLKNSNNEEENESVIETYYQTQLKYFVNPAFEDEGENIHNHGAYGASLLNNMAALLEGELFAEKVLDAMMLAGVEYVPTEKYQAGTTEYTLEYREWILFLCDVTNYTSPSNEIGAQSVIEVTVSVKETETMEKEKEKATAIKNQLLESVPAYIAANMCVPDGYDHTNCQLLTLLTDVQTVVYENGQKIK